ncbi:MAG: nucleotidyl transferase AbiEii/AbiGii toxin family protein [Planctomycetes bacterium]|nr:nucleotidyl transferase AbiEii/AbiGii toxin family protein [Planctomycetota bacterium]
MPSQTSLALRLRESSQLSQMQVTGMIPPERVAEVLEDAGVTFVLAGAHALAGWTRMPRATMDVDVVVLPRHHKKAVKAIQDAFPTLETTDVEVVTRFADPATKNVLIDLLKPKDNLLKTVFEHSVRLKIAGRTIPVPDLEMAAAMKFAAMVGVYRKRADKEQDGVDFRRVVEANKTLDVERLARFGDFVYAGGGAEVRRLITAIRKGEPLVF